MFSHTGRETRLGRQACHLRPLTSVLRSAGRHVRVVAVRRERSRAAEEQAHFQEMQRRTFCPPRRGVHAVTVIQGWEEIGCQKANSSVSHGFPSLSLWKYRSRQMESPPDSPQCHWVPPKGTLIRQRQRVSSVYTQHVDRPGQRARQKYF